MDYACCDSEATNKHAHEKASVIDYYFHNPGGAKLPTGSEMQPTTARTATPSPRAPRAKAERER